MQFLNPQFLFALFALAIPILVHLFNFRRYKKVFFTNVRFLQEIRQDTQNRSRLRNLLILAARLLAVTFLVLAFAQPYLPATRAAKRAAERRVAVWIDNSFSMDAQGSYGTLLDEAKKKAREIALAYAPSDKFILVTNDFESRHQHLVNREEFLQWIDAVQPGPAARTVGEAMLRARDGLKSGNLPSSVSFDAYLLSDFQQRIADLATAPADSTVHVHLLPLQANATANLFIDTCYLESPVVQLGSPNELIVTVRNSGDMAVENVPIRLTINGYQKALASVPVAAGARQDVRLAFTVQNPGWQEAVVSLTDYPVTFDDTFHFTFRVRTDVPVVAINGSSGDSPYLQALFGRDPYFRYRSMPVGQADYNALTSPPLVILNQVETPSSGLISELDRYVRKGGKLLVFLPAEPNAEAYRALGKQLDLPVPGPLVRQTSRVGKVETGDPLFRDVFEKGKALPENPDLPLVNAYFNLPAATARRSDVLMRLDNGIPFLQRLPVGAGQVFLLASPPDPAFTSFPQHALFVPVMLKLALSGSSEIDPPVVIGQAAGFSAGDTLLPGEQVYHLVRPADGFDVLPEFRQTESGGLIYVHDQVRQAGTYRLEVNRQLVRPAAFNYDRKESDLRTSDVDEVLRALQVPAEVVDSRSPDLTHNLTRANNGLPLWKYCIVLTLFFLAAEVALIRFLRT
jgi:hypothetical protein